MTTDKKAFGNFLREMISQTKISQAAFYEAVGITKPYFYDILSGKVNPPPPDVQYVTIIVEVPKNLTSEQKDTLEKFAEQLSDKNYNKKKKFSEKLKDFFD